MTTITKKCPHCNTQYSHKAYSGRPSKDNQTCYGSPLRRCQKCGNFFIDKDYREIAISGIREVDTQRVSTGTMVESAIPIIGSCIYFCIAQDGTRWAALIVFLICVGSVVSEYRGYDKRIAHLEQEKAESYRRMSNPQYAMMLKTLGYDVPDEFLIIDDISDEKTI